MGASISVRDARLDDAPLLADWQVAMAAETEGLSLGRARVLSGVRRCLADPVKGRYLLATIDGAPVGSLLLTREWSDWRDGWFWWIQSVYLVPQARGLGVFRAMYDAVLARAAADADVCGLRLYVDAGNAHAQRVYARLGMARTDYRFFEATLSPRRPA